MNKLWFGDNLTILREEIRDESIDLVYLDPPFNSQANYNVLFRTPDDDAASAQVEAFRDTWTWGPEAEWAFEEIMRTGGGVTSIIHALRSALGESDMMAYLVMMAQRLHELRRVLKPTGSLYLHCDSTASHYLKIILDAVFGPTRFLNEITWRRTSAHNDGQRYGRIQDRLLFYSKTSVKKFRHVGGEYSPEQRARYRHEEDGRWYKAENLTAPHYSPTRTVEWRGTHPGKNRQWRFGEEELERLWEANKILLRRDGRPRKDGLKEYLDENESPALQDLWTDIKRIGNTSSERLGYPTQKPVSLLKRVIEVSTDPGDVILDPFCGCGTSIAAAEALSRAWIGIDVAFHAIRVIEDRLADMPGKVEYDLGGIPRDFASATKLAERDKYQFQWWANYLVGVQALKEVRKGPDRGIDGQMFFMNGPRGWGRVLTSVKGGQHVGVKDVREFKAVIGRENAEMGLFICLREPTREMRSEAASFGFVDTVHGHLPRLQIVSIESWFAGTRPALPSLGHLSRDYFRSPTKTQKADKTRRPDPNAPEFPFTFLGDKKTSVVHFNPNVVTRESEQKAML